MEALKHEDE
jgi:hypothetical protein